MQSRGGASYPKTGAIHILWSCSWWINAELYDSELQCNVRERHILGQSVIVEDVAPALLWCLYVALCRFKATNDKVCFFIPWNVSNVTEVEDWAGADKECIKGQILSFHPLMYICDTVTCVGKRKKQCLFILLTMCGFEPFLLSQCVLHLSFLPLPCQSTFNLCQNKKIYHFHSYNKGWERWIKSLKSNNNSGNNIWKCNYWKKILWA